MLTLLGIVVISIVNMSHNSNLWLSNGNFYKWRLNHFTEIPSNTVKIP